jgi:tetratricopeptide (TPR) repeat protein
MSLVLLASSKVWAQDSKARAREDRARTACAAGRVDEGVEILARLHTEFRHSNYIFNQARCYQQNGQLEQALTRFQEYLRVATEVSPEERARAQRYADEVQAQLAARRKPEPAPAATPAPAPPPTAIVETHAPATPVAEPNYSPRFRNVSIILGAVAVVGAAGGVVSSLRIRSLEHAVEGAAPASVTAADLNARASEAHRFETLQWVGYGLGGVALLGSIVFAVMGHEPGGGGRGGGGGGGGGAGRGGGGLGGGG